MSEIEALREAVARVRALETFSITDSYPAWTAVDHDDLLAALDGAPEPEAKPSITVDEAALARVVRSALPYDVEVAPFRKSKTELHFRTVADGDLHVERITRAVAEYLTGGMK